MAGQATSSTVSPEMLTTHSRASARMSSVVSTISLHAGRKGRLHVLAATHRRHSSSWSCLHPGFEQAGNQLHSPSTASSSSAGN